MKYWLKTLEQQLAIYKKVMKEKIDEGDDSKEDGETKDKAQLQHKEHDSTENLMKYWLKTLEHLLPIYKKVMRHKIDEGDDSKKDGETKGKEKLQQKEQGSTQKLLAIYKKVMEAKIDKGDGATKEKQLQQKEHDPNQNVMKYWLK